METKRMKRRDKRRDGRGKRAKKRGHADPPAGDEATPMDLCACGRPGVSVCLCELQESECAAGHHWYLCEEHGRRVNRKHDPGVACGH